MKKHIRTTKTLIYLLLVVVFSSCESPNSNMGDRSTSTLPAMTQTHVAPAPSIDPTLNRSTPSVITNEKTPSGQPTLEITETSQVESTPTTNHLSLIPTCLQDGVPTEIPENFGITGAIAYKDGELDGFYTLGGSPFILSRLPIPGKVGDKWRGSLFGFSPNGEWLSYAPIVGEIGPIGVKHEVLRIGSLSSKGIKIENDVDVDDFDAILPDDKPSIGWFVNQWINDGLIHSTLAYRKNGHLMISHFNSVLNPFNGKWRDELITGLPGSTRMDGAVYSPDMTRVIYLRKNHGLVLRDINNDDQIWVDNDFISIYGGIVEWAPDSSLTAFRNVGSSDEIFIMDRNGNNVTDIVDRLSYPVKPSTGSVFRWSPVNHQLAFTVFQGGIINQKTLYIYDVNTNDVVYLCPLYQSEREGDIDFYWSPDGRQIAYSYFHYDPLIVIDILTGQVFKLVDKAIIHGWSGKFPAILPVDD